MPRTIDKFTADLPLDQQEEIERRYQALRRTLPLPKSDKAKDALPAVPSTKQRRS